MNKCDANCYDCRHFSVCKHTPVGGGRLLVPVEHDDQIKPLLTSLASICARYCKHFEANPDA